MKTKPRLRDAFLEDHRKLTRGLSALVRLVENGEWEQAVRRAEELDRIAGPHIEFEERRFYPQVSRSRGKDYVDNLYDEHRSGREAIEMLRAAAGRTNLSKEERERLLFHLHRALDHVVSCGTLLSHVTSLDDEEQDKLLADLEGYRKAGHRWTELSRGTLNEERGEH